MVNPLKLKKMKIKLDYDNTEVLEHMIDRVYTSNNGKKGSNDKIIIEKNDIYYTLLSNIPHDQVRLTNSIIDGSLICNKNEFEDRIELSPNASYCIETEDKYSFY